MNIAIITGASSGIGREFALQLVRILKKTDEIWLLARRKDALEEVAELLSTEVKKHESEHDHKSRQNLKRMPKIQAIPIDIADEKQLAGFAEALMIKNARISVLVNCAGIGTYGSFEKLSREEVAETVRVNVFGLTQLTKFCLPYMRKGSKIIQAASGSAFLPQPDFAVYAASKAYVYSFGRALHKELRKDGISVTVICPGPVDTPFLAHAYGRYGQMNLLKKITMVKPEKVVHKALTDSKRRREISIYGLPMNLLYRLTRGMMG